MHMEMLSGNEAVARGVYEAGCHVAAAYPGTPSTEILENIGEKYKDEIYCQWACNEKTAVEIAGGASIGGARAFAAMKHVGMNVAADPIFTLAYSGVNGGFVFVSADDPGLPHKPKRAGKPPESPPRQFLFPGGKTQPASVYFFSKFNSGGIVLKKSRPY